MDLNPQRRDWFFPIEEAPVLITVTHKSVARDVRVPHKKALIAADTGDIVGIVGAGYKVFTNQQAVTLCHKFCLEAFPDTTPAEWTFVEGHGPDTRSWAAMDIHHRAHAMNLMGKRRSLGNFDAPSAGLPARQQAALALKISRGRWDFLEFHITVMRVAPASSNG
jgi:hypothetical protein